MANFVVGPNWDRLGFPCDCSELIYSVTSFDGHPYTVLAIQELEVVKVLNLNIQFSMSYNILIILKNIILISYKDYKYRNVIVVCNNRLTIKEIQISNILQNLFAQYRHI